VYFFGDIEGGRFSGGATHLWDLRGRSGTEGEKWFVSPVTPPPRPPPLVSGKRSLVVAEPPGDRPLALVRWGE